MTVTEFREKVNDISRSAKEHFGEIMVPPVAYVLSSKEVDRIDIVRIPQELMASDYSKKILMKRFLPALLEHKGKENVLCVAVVVEATMATAKAPDNFKQMSPAEIKELVKGIVRRDVINVTFYTPDTVTSDAHVFEIVKGKVQWQETVSNNSIDERSTFANFF